MLVNNENGSLKLIEFNTQLYKGMLLEQLKQTDFYKEKYQNRWDVKTGYFWYYFKTIEVESHQLSFSLCFLGDQLHSIHMHTWEKTDAKDWNEWTEEKEMQVFHRNNKFLSLILGVPPTQKKKTPYPSCTFIFPWGSVWSVYDPRSASSFMGISYEEKK
ncbi:Uncharacterised protein [Chryseobacterium nakagawai]|uniref:Uncharacterized protein n=1 Tax=Chryseobacterium nakagawai TaxID=1241982 RepID=A0AAD0YS04_CHRNA|nr:hypothetical protein [Chryseobacterium nakagawai]AZA93113.1 hypothetical protein EG343_22155 [Chryseobacterium nakagawai]VEH19756.1 Uncharacterised protein [Chryseobacterium nakagawai]